MARRVQTEQVFDEHFGHQGEHDSPPYNVDDLSDDDIAGANDGVEDPYGDEDYNEDNEDLDYEDGQNQNNNNDANDGGVNDLVNYKGIYFNDD